MSEAVISWVGLGSNIAPKQEYLRRAVTEIGNISGVVVRARSSVYFTEPQGLREQAWFANQVLKLACDPGMEPETLLTDLWKVEDGLGRRRAIRNGPRTIDCDLLLFGDCQQRSNFLTLPHPQMLQRAFVLIPILEIAGNVSLPGGGSVIDALKQLHYSVSGRIIRQS